MWALFLQQTTTTPQAVDLPTSVQGAIIILLLFASREVPTRLLSYLDLRIQEWKKRVETMQEMGEQITKLFAEINTLYDRIGETEERGTKRVNEAETKAKTDLETQHKAHEEFISQVKDEFTRKIEAAVREVAEGKDVVINNQAATIQTLTTQLKEVTDERDQLRIENIELKEELAKVTPPQMPAVPSTPTPPDQVGNAPLAPDESSSKLPGLPP